MVTIVNPTPTERLAIDSSNVQTYYTGTISTADSYVVGCGHLGPSVTVTIVTAAATTATVEFSTTPNAVNNSATANWQPWPDGTVAGGTSVTDVFVGRLHALRFTRASGVGNVVYEVTA